MKQEEQKTYMLAGMFTLSLRLVVGWTYFSAFWRRLILENKLIPDTTGYTNQTKHSLIIPLGAKATLRVSDPSLRGLSPGDYKVVLTDISGATWTQQINKLN